MGDIGDHIPLGERIPNSSWLLADEVVEGILHRLPNGTAATMLRNHMAEAERAAFQAGYDRGGLVTQEYAAAMATTAGAPSESQREHPPVERRQLDEVRRAVYGTSEDRSPGFAAPSVLEQLMELAQDQKAHLADITGLTKRIAKLDAFAIDSMSRLDALEKADQLSVESHGEARGRTNRLEGGIAIIQAQIADIQAQVREMDPVDERVKTAVDMITGTIENLQKRVSKLDGEVSDSGTQREPMDSAVCLNIAIPSLRWYLADDSESLTQNPARVLRMTRTKAADHASLLRDTGHAHAMPVTAP